MDPTSRLSAAGVAALALLILGALIVPRLVALRGVELTASFSTCDSLAHLWNLEKLNRRASMDPARARDPYLTANPRALEPWNQASWPAGVYRVARPLAAAFGTLSIWTTQLTNLLFFLVLLGGVVGLGLAMGGGLRLGLWGALLTALCPALVASSWYFSLDFPLVAMTTVGLALLWRTRHFGDRLFVLLLVLWSTLGMQVKPTYALYLALPTLVWLATALRGERRWRALANFGAGLLAWLALVWWLADASPGEAWRQLLVHMSREVPDPYLRQVLTPAPAWSLAGLTMVGRFLVMSFPLPLLLLALVPLAALALPRERLRGKALLLTFLGGTYLLMTLMPNRQERYCQPIYPLLCLITAWWVLARIPRRWQLPTMGWVVSAYCVVLVLAHQHPTPWLRGIGVLPELVSMEMPGQRRLAALRATTYNPHCDLRPLIRSLVALSRAEGSRRPLGVGLRVKFPRPVLDEELSLMAAHLIRERLVLGVFVGGDQVPPPPSLLLVHGPGADPARMAPRMRRVARRELTVACGQWRGRVALSLLQGP